MNRRRSIRLPHYDYRDEGAYFITICTHHHLCLFGYVMDDIVEHTSYGRIAADAWLAIPQHFTHVALDHYVVMPNHVHGILFIEDHPKADLGARHTANEDNKEADVGAQYIVPLHSTKRSFGSMVAGSLPSIVRTYKAAVTREINRTLGMPSAKIWQRNYYEHIIRSERDLNRIRDYILTNPARWAEDEYHC